MKKFSPLFFYAALFLAYVVAGFAHASQRGEVGIRGPVVGSLSAIDTTVANLTTSAYSTLQASMPAACSSIFVQNTGTGIAKIAIGGAGVEVDTGYFIPASSQAWILPIEIKKGARVSVKLSPGTQTSQTSGIISLSCMQ